MTRFIQTDFDNGLSLHYNQYMNYPLMELKAALEPFLESIDQLSRRIQDSKNNCQLSPHRLSTEESAAIYLYAAEQDKPTLHNKLNQALRSGNQSMIESWFGFLKLFNTALEKLPTVKTTLWCGMHTDIAETLQENQVIVWSTVCSCSSSIDIIKFYVRNIAVLCSIEAINGKNIRGYTRFINEDEVLLLPGTRLRVKRSGYDSSIGQYVISLVEICNDYQSLPPSIDDFLSSNQNSSEHDVRIDDLRTNNESSITTFSNGDRYEIMDENGKKQIYVKYYQKNGVVYEGYDADIRANGNGIRICSNGDRYTGNFKKGKMFGDGTYTRGNSYQYVGNWMDGVATGKGTSVWSNGNHYEGDHQDGKITGHGTFHSDYEDKYDGYLVDGKAHGRGLRIWKNGDQYEGGFKNDKKHGYGVYTYATGAEYRGDWVDDEMNGQGIFKWSGGTQYEGAFKNGKRHGQGKLIFATGQVQDGRWENDQYIG